MPDDRFMEGVYYDASVGEMYRFERDDDAEAVTVRDPHGERVESLSFDEFVDLQPDLYPVPEEAVENPVNYFEREVSKRLEDAEFEPGLLYANEMTRVVEDDGGTDDE